MANEAGLLKMIMQSLHSPPAVSYVVLSLLVNLMSAVGLIQLNKYIYLNYAFPNMALTCLHFVVTFVGLFLTCRLGSRQFSVKRVPIGKMLPMAVSSCLSVVLTNYSLQYNSVGTYQCFKTFNTPGVVIISYYFYKKHYSTRVILTIIPILLGIYVNSMYDISFSLAGTLFGLSGATVTTFYQVWIKEKQEEFKLNSMQLLFYQAPLSAIILLFMVPIFEQTYGLEGKIVYFELSYSQWLVIILSSVMALLFNLSTFWIIGTTSALTYNMFSYVKFILIIAFGVILFSEAINIQQLFAFFLILTGIVFYSIFFMQETSGSKVSTSSSSSFASAASAGTTDQQSKNSSNGEEIEQLLVVAGSAATTADDLSKSSLILNDDNHDKETSSGQTKFLLKTEYNNTHSLDNHHNHKT